MTDEREKKTSGASVTPLRQPRKCPICKRPAVAAHRPFCSRRCAEVDLGRWLGGAYALPGDAAESPENGLPDQEDDY